MKNYTVIPTSPYLRMNHGLDSENQSDHKVIMVSELDMSSAERLRSQTERDTGKKPSYAALTVKAIALALRCHRHANRILVGVVQHRVVELQDVDISVATERDIPGREQAVFVETIRQADTGDHHSRTEHDGCGDPGDERTVASVSVDGGEAPEPLGGVFGLALTLVPLTLGEAPGWCSDDLVPGEVRRRSPRRPLALAARLLLRSRQGASVRRRRRTRGPADHDSQLELRPPVNGGHRRRVSSRLSPNICKMQKNGFPEQETP